MTIHIRVEIPSDIRGIASLVREAFGSEDEVRLVQLLRERGELAISLVAVDNGDIVGHVATSPTTVNGTQVEIVGIAPLSVRTAYRRQGIGASLMAAVLEQIKSQKFIGAVLLGDPSYYPRFGFKTASQYNLDNEYNATDAFMAIELQVDALSEVSGMVQYSSAFTECGT